MKNGLSPTLPERGGRKEEDGILNVEKAVTPYGRNPLRLRSVTESNACARIKY